VVKMKKIDKGFGNVTGSVLKVVELKKGRKVASLKNGGEVAA
jgi:hypothetical protein